MGSNFELSNNVLFGVKYFQKEEKGEGGGGGGVGGQVHLGGFDIYN